MKVATVKLIEEKFKNDINVINYEIYKNKRDIKALAEKQKKLKDTRKGLYDIIKLLRG